MLFTLSVGGSASAQPAPAVEAVYLIHPPPGGVHTFGDTVEVHARFNREDLWIAGRPRLALTIGAHTRHAKLRTIFSHEGERRYFSFTYVVQASDRDDDGISIPANALTLDGGFIRDADGNDADLTHDAAPDDPEHMVNGSMGAPATAGRWTDHPIRPGVTSIKAVHFEELRARVAALREGVLAPVQWTDPVLTPGVTPVGLTHLAELRAALGGVYDARAQRPPTYTDPILAAGRTPVRAVHVMELREAVDVLETVPPLAPYYTILPVEVIDPSYRPHAQSEFSASTDLDGDGNEDLVLLGATYPWAGRGDVTTENYRPQPGRVLLGDGDGGFRLAPAELFPVDTLNTVHPRNVPFGDLNADGLPDMFIADHGWDAPPFPGEQNRLYLSRPGGGWRDATSELPRLSDFSHSAAIGDIRGLGTPDIVVGNIVSILPYVLLNDGDETFSLDRSSLPVGPGETLDFVSGGLPMIGTVLADLDGDGLPELISLGERSRGHLWVEAVSFVFWNRAGAFSDEHKTPLPSPEVFARHGHIGLDAAVLDADGDGLLDLVIVGTQSDPFYDGWFVQLLMNQGDGTFADETSLRLQPQEQSSGNPGVATGAPWAMWVDVLDFNGDGAADFVMTPTAAPPNLPLIWLNDGSGRFSALKVHDFVRPGDEWLLENALLVRTRHGYSYITTQSYGGGGGLILTGLLATRPYR